MGTDDRTATIVALARARHEEEGALEFDDTPAVAEGEDNGAYVQAWVWVSFDGTPLDKHQEG